MMGVPQQEIVDLDVDTTIDPQLISKHLRAPAAPEPPAACEVMRSRPSSNAAASESGQSRVSSSLLQPKAPSFFAFKVDPSLEKYMLRPSET